MLRSLIASLAGAVLLSAAGAAQSAVVVYTTSMAGANEVPPNGSLATGFTSVTVDDSLNTLSVNVTWSGLTAPASAAHIHCCIAPGGTAIVAVPFTSFVAATSGAYNHVFDLTDTATYNGAFLTGAGGGTAAGAEAALLAGLAAGDAYSNIHDANFPAGEIRGFLAPATVPEPGSWVLMIAGFGLAGVGLRRRRALAA